MIIILSPAKNMIEDTDSLPPKTEPVFLDETQKLLSYLKSLPYEKLKCLWNTSDKLTKLNYERLKALDLSKANTPAVFAFSGLAYKYLKPRIFTYDEFEYIEKHLRILSGFYGVLSPFDKVIPYRLELKAKIEFENYKNLYQFWGSKVAGYLFSKTDTIINLASKEYSKFIIPYLTPKSKFITCIFGELENGRIIEKGALVKMARGEMARFMTENNILDIEGLKDFDRLNYHFEKSLSSPGTLVFIKKHKQEKML